jgi:phospholipase/carboxylesterase
MAGFDLRLVEVGSDLDTQTGPIVVLLHGFSMCADDLVPFGASLGLPGLFVFPEGPIDLSPRPREKPARAWWHIDAAGRSAALTAGHARDLADQSPAGLPAARTAVLRLIDEIGSQWPGRPLFIGGFSQGAILSLDVAMHIKSPLAGLVMLSGGRVTAGDWASGFHRLKDLPILQSHGRQDRDLSFEAAQALGDDLTAAGADITWCPFDGGHEIPLAAWRELKRFIRRYAAREPRKMLS